jgi:hypothetical protein
MKKLAIIFALLLGYISSYACCAAGLITVSPQGQHLSQNPLILIDYMERDYGVFNALAEAIFFLKDSSGNIYELEIVDMVRSRSVSAQVLLKPKTVLEKGKVLSLGVKNLQSNHERTPSFIHQIQQKNWTVSFDYDGIAPTFERPPYTTYKHSFQSTAPGHWMYGIVYYSDNNTYAWGKNDAIKTQIILEIADSTGKKIYKATDQRNAFWISDAMCGSDFELKLDTEYTFLVRLIDFSGNKSKEARQVSFKTVKSYRG